MTQACATCNGSRLLFGGWMGPTPERPYPDPCPDCSSGMSAREMQVVQTEWLLDNQHRSDVQQILARMAVHDAQHYRLVVLAARVSGPGIATLLQLDADLIQRADLVVGTGRLVLKDRYGAEGYKLSDTELRRILADCERIENISP